MNVLIILLMVIGALLVLILIAALFVKKDYAVRRDITIDRTSAVIFDYIKYLKNQDNYNKWAMMDPAAKKNYIGTDGTVGFVSTWDSQNKNAGKGEQEIRKISDNTRIDCEIRFERPFKNVAQIFMELTPVSEKQTRLQWGMEGKNPYPFNLMNLFIPDMLGKDLNTSLVTLKNILER